MKEEGLEVFNIVKFLSSIFVGFEKEINNNPNMSIKAFSKKYNDPVRLLYSKGFSGLITMAALVPIKEALDNNTVDGEFEWSKLREARNALCHGTIEFLDNGKIKFIDRKKEVELTSKEIIDLASKAYEAYLEQNLS